MQLKSSSFAGSTNLTSESIKKRFDNYETWQPIAELIWNGLDANATRIDIFFKERHLPGTEMISVLDNGDGINVSDIDNNFGRFDDTTKTDISQRGSHGRGRLSFHRIASEAVWYTRSEGKDSFISITSSDIRKYEGDYLDKFDQNQNLQGLESGTYVELKGFEFKKNIKESALIKKLSLEFGWFLALHRSKRIYLNNIEICIPEHSIHKFSENIHLNEFDVGIIRWEDKPSSEKSYICLMNTAGKLVHKQLSSFNNKTDFYITAYVTSKWADNFKSGDPNLFVNIEQTSQSQVWKSLTENLSQKIQAVYHDFLRVYADDKISKLEEDGAFPSDKGESEEYSSWKRENTKRLVKTIYCADPTLFNSLSKKQGIILVRLLGKIMISNENDSLLEVLESVIDLDSVYLRSLANQLQRTKLEHIISTIEILQRREIVISKLREVMDNHYEEVLETPDLQKIIESNTWLFGEQYNILGAEEDSFQSIAKNLRDEISGIASIQEQDIEEDSQIEGVRRQVDLFLARKLPSYNSSGKLYYRCIVVEIKRPSISLNNKHVRQLEDYAGILAQHNQFKSESMKFELILVGRNISKDAFLIESKLNDNLEKGDPGLISSGSGKFKMYVKNWNTIFDEFLLSNNYLLEHLKTQREELSGRTREELIGELQEPSQ